MGLEDPAAAQASKAHVHAYVNAFYFGEDDLHNWIKVTSIIIILFFLLLKKYIFIYFYLSSYLVNRVSVYLFLFYLFIYLVYIFVLFCFEHELLLAGSVKDFVEIRHICKLLVLRGAIVSRTKYC